MGRTKNRSRQYIFLFHVVKRSLKVLALTITLGNVIAYYRLTLPLLKACSQFVDRLNAHHEEAPHSSRENASHWTLAKSQCSVEG